MILRELSEGEKNSSGINQGYLQVTAVKVKDWENKSKPEHSLMSITPISISGL